MKISILSESENVLNILFEAVTPEFLNTLRRAIMFETPVMAIEDVYFTKNSSALYDEIIAHRLGLLPIKSPAVGDKELVFELKAEGPKMVYAKDIVSKEKGAKVLYPNSPIVKLAKNQKLEFKASASKGTGLIHTKWSPALCYYSNYVTAKVGGKEVKSSNPIELSRHLLDLGQSAQELNGKKADINKSKDKFIFTVESWGQIPTREILTESVKVIKEKFKGLKLK